MEPVWGEYGSGMGLMRGLDWLTVRAVGGVKDWEEGADPVDQLRMSSPRLHQ